MDATLKSTLNETVIRLANGCTIHLDHRQDQVSTWAPGARQLLARTKPDDLDLRDALHAGLQYQPPSSP